MTTTSAWKAIEREVEALASILWDAGVRAMRWDRPPPAKPEVRFDFGFKGGVAGHDDVPWIIVGMGEYDGNLHEYRHITNDPVIGSMSGIEPGDYLAALVAHEIAHAVDITWRKHHEGQVADPPPLGIERLRGIVIGSDEWYEADSEGDTSPWSAHGIVWQSLYRVLRPLATRHMRSFARRHRVRRSYTKTVSAERKKEDIARNPLLHVPVRLVAEGAFRLIRDRTGKTRAARVVRDAILRFVPSSRPTYRDYARAVRSVPAETLEEISRSFPFDPRAETGAPHDLDFWVVSALAHLGNVIREEIERKRRERRRETRNGEE